MNYQTPIPPATFLEDSYQYLARQIQERFVMIGLLGSLYGTAPSTPHASPTDLLMSVDSESRCAHPRLSLVDIRPRTVRPMFAS